VPGLAPDAQPARAGVRWRARPNRSSSGHSSAGPTPQPVIAACAAASWFHDGSVQGPVKTGRGNNWVVLAIIVRLPFCDRPVALPALAKLVVKGTNSESPGVAGPADGGPARRRPARPPPARRGRLRLCRGRAGEGRNVDDPGCGRTPPSTGCRRPRVPGRKGRPASAGTGCRPWPGSPATPEFTQVAVTRYGKREAVSAAVVTCLWHSVFGTRHVQVVLARDKSSSGYDLALVTTPPRPHRRQISHTSP
jgi:hypothetical protein